MFLCSQACRKVELVLMDQLHTLVTKPTKVLTCRVQCKINREIKIVQICEAMQIRRCSKLPPPAVGCPSHLLRLTDRSHRSQIAFESIVSHCSKCKNSIKMYKIVAFTSQNLLWTHQLASTCSALFLSSGKSWVYCPSAAPVPMDRAMALAHWKQRAEAPKHQIEP